MVTLQSQNAQAGAMPRLLIPLADLPLPSRVRKCMGKLGLAHVGDVVALSRSTLLAQPSFGRTSLQALTGVLAKLGLNLEMTPEGWPPANFDELYQVHRESICESVTRVIVPHESDSLEDELRQLAAPAGTPRNVRIVLRYFGWDGRERFTLEDIARQHQISKQRVLNIVNRVRRPYKQAQVRPPRLERCLREATPNLVDRAGEVEARLHRTGETDSPFRLEGLLAATDVLGLQAPFEIFRIGAVRVVARRGGKSHVLSLIRRTRGSVGRLGAVDLREMADLLQTEADDLRTLLSLSPGAEWLDDSKNWVWFRPALTKDPVRTRNRLVNAIGKILCVAPKVEVGDLRSGVARQHRPWRRTPPDTTLLEICRRLPWCDVQDGVVFRRGHLDWSALARGTKEGRLALAVRSAGGVVTREQLEDLGRSLGLSRWSVNSLSSTSPVLDRVRPGVFLLRGVSVDPGSISEIRRSLILHRRMTRAWRESNPRPAD